MKDQAKPKEQLIKELQALRRRLAKLEGLGNEAKRIELLHRESERKLSTLVGNLPGMAYRGLNDTNWTMEFVSEGCLELTGYPTFALIGNRKLAYNELIHPEDQDAVWNGVQECLGQKRPYRLTYRIKTASGEEKWVWEQGEGVFSENGDLLALEGFITDITRQKVLEESYRESERKLSTLIGNLPGMAYRCLNDANWTMEFISEGCLELTGYRADDLIGNRKLAYSDIIKPEDQDRVWKQIQKAVAERRPFRVAYGIKTASGEEKWVWEQGAGVFSVTGELLALEGFVTDVTERKRAEEALRSSEMRYRTFLDVVPIPILVILLDGVVSYLNPAFKQTFGWGLDELRGGKIPFFPPGPGEEAAENSRRLLEEGILLPHETKRLTKDGRVLDVVISAVVYSESEDKPAGELVILRDVTREKKIARNNEIMRRISMALPEYPELDELLEYISKEVKRLLGAEMALVYLLDEEKNMLSFKAGAHDDSDVEERMQALHFSADKGIAGKVVRTGKPAIANDVSKDPDVYSVVDREIGLECRSLLDVPLRSKDRIIGVLCAGNKKEGVFDQTDMALLNTVAGTVALSIENARFSLEIKDAYREVTSLNKAKDKVINHLSHELQTPVSVLAASLSVLRRKLEALSEDSWQRTMARIDRNLERLREVQYEVDDIIQYGRYETYTLLSTILDQCGDEIEALIADEVGEGNAVKRVRERVEEVFGPKVTTSEEVLLHEFVEERLRELKPLYAHRRLEIITSIAPAPAILMPKDALRKVIDGLLKNAIENTPDGGEIEIEVGKAGHGSQFIVHDFGVGIVADDQRRIFEGFFATQDTMDYASKRPFDFNAGGKGADLLRMKIFSERYHFKIDMESTRCGFIPGDEDICPGRIRACGHCLDTEDCQKSGGTTFVVYFPPAVAGRREPDETLETSSQGS